MWQTSDCGGGRARDPQLTTFAQSSDPLVGTWNLNVAKSKGAKSGSTTIEAAGKEIKFMVDLVPADGTPTHWEFTANFDGKDYPAAGNSPYGNTTPYRSRV